MADTQGMDPNFAAKLDALIAASGGQIWINSGYRSTERQTQLWDAKLAAVGGNEQEARKWVAPPGHSNHEKGLAADLGGDLELAHRLAPQFGLVFPMSWEAWHIEPPEARNADAMTTPAPGHPDPATDPNGYGSLSNQLITFQNLVKGVPVTAAAPTGDGASPEPGAAAPGESGSSGGTGAPVEAAHLYEALTAQGVDPVHAAALVAIAGRESGYRPDAHNGNAATGDDSWGLFQINKLGGQHSQYSTDQLATFEGSVAAGADLVKSGGLSPWGPYKGQSWATGTDLGAAAAASGGAVTLADLQAIANEGLK